MPNLTYHRPTDVAAAQSLLRQPNTAPLAFGPRIPEEGHGPVEAVVDLRALALNYIRRTDTTVIIGAHTPLQALIESEASLPLLADAARLAAPLTLRHLATVGGAWQTTAGSPEIKLALLALGATPQPAEMPIEFVLPLAPAGTGSAVERVARAPRDEAIVAAAAVVTAQHGLLRQVRVAVGGAHPQPIRLPTIEAMLDGQPYSAELLQRAEVTIVNEAQPVADFRASADYRRAMGGVLARRALTAAWQQATA